MDHRSPRRQAGFNSRTFRESDRLGSRPDRIAFWAVILAVVVLVAAAASAHAASGGIGGGGGKNGCADSDFGARKLSLGDCGADVKTLNWILHSRDFGARPRLGDEFDGRTKKAVGGLQERGRAAAVGGRQRRHPRRRGQHDAQGRGDLVRPRVLRQQDRLRAAADASDRRRGPQVASLRIAG